MKPTTIRVPHRLLPPLMAAFAVLALLAGTAFTSAPAATSAPTTAAARYGWGSPIAGDEFNTPGAPRSDWSVYNGPGHHNEGKRSPAAWKGNGSVMQVSGDAAGTTGGMSANWPGSDSKGGRWEVRMRTSQRDPRYHAVLILWPQDGYLRGKCDGEVDFSESTKDTTKTHFFLHHGCDNAQTTVAIPNDTTAWHNYAVEWSPGKAMRGFIDGREWFTDTKVSDLPPQPMHLTIQLDYFPGDGSGALKPSWMQVDWARQYALSGSTPSPTTTTATRPPTPGPLPTVTVTKTVTETVTVTASPTNTGPLPPSPTDTATTGPSPADDLKVAAVGDMNPSGNTSADSASGKTAAAIAAAKPDVLLGLGDFQYSSGSCDALKAYDAAGWGALQPILYGTAGPTHDWDATNSTGQQWGAYMSGQCPGQTSGKSAAATLVGGTLSPADHYSFDKGAWHFVQLSSGCYRYTVCDNAADLQWLNGDLDMATKAGKHVVAFWHEPYWTRPTAEHTATTAVKPLMQALAAHGVRLVLNGHQHGYQRFAPMNLANERDANGVQEFVVGTGGIGFYPFTGSAPGIDASNADTNGWLGLTLHADGSYSWRFAPTAGGTFTDTGTRS